MKREIGELLLKAALEKAKKYSDSSRPENYTQETFKLLRIIPLSDEVVWVHYEKRKGNIAKCLFIWINKGKVNGKLINGWFSFFPSDSHMFGLSKIMDNPYNIDEFNFGIYNPQYDME